MKIHCIIQARMGSTRLPGKVIEMLGDRTLLGMVYERCATANGIDKVIVASHELDFTDGPCVQGPEEPAARFVKVLAEYPCDGFVRICADSPFIDAASIEWCVGALEAGGGCAFNNSIWGNQAEGFETKEFLKSEPNMVGDEREHLGLHFHRRNRLTVDTPGDLERARLIVSRMTKPHTEYTAAECLELLRNA